MCASENVKWGRLGFLIEMPSPFEDGILSTSPAVAHLTASQFTFSPSTDRLFSLELKLKRTQPNMVRIRSWVERFFMNRFATKVALDSVFMGWRLNLWFLTRVGVVQLDKPLDLEKFFCRCGSTEFSGRWKMLEISPSHESERKNR